jgi:hypothetical protein
VGSTETGLFVCSIIRGLRAGAAGSLTGLDQSSLLELFRRPVVERFVEPDVLDQPTYSTIASSSCVRARQTRWAMSSVLKESRKLSASALSNASPTVPIEASRPWSSGTE